MGKKGRDVAKCWLDDVDAIQEAMNAMGITQTRLAELVGMSQPSISDIVRRRRGMSVETAKKIRAALGLVIVHKITIRDPGLDGH